MPSVIPPQLGSDSDEMLLRSAEVGPSVPTALPSSVMELLRLTNDIGTPLPTSLFLPQSGAPSAAGSTRATSRRGGSKSTTGTPPHPTAAARQTQSWTDLQNLQSMTNDLGDPIPLSVFQRSVAELDEGLQVESHTAAVRRLVSTAPHSKRATRPLRVPGLQEPTEDGRNIGIHDLLGHRRRLGGAKIEGEGTGLKTADCTMTPQSVVSKLRAKAIAQGELGPASPAPSSSYVDEELLACLRGPRARVHADEPGEIAKQCSPTVDSDAESECSAPSEPDESAEVVVGPTDLAVTPLKLEDLCLFQLERHTGTMKRVPLVSNPRRLSLADALRLSQARPEEAPLSFGSTLHLNYGAGQPCRPCMFERWAGRCNKSWLCDFCHLHTVQKARRDGPRAQARTKAAASRRKQQN